MVCRFSACTARPNYLDTRSHCAWPVRLSVRTPGFQPGKRGSIPLRAANSSHRHLLILRAIFHGISQCVGFLDVGGGFILAHGEDDEEMRRCVAADPFVAHDVVSADVLHVDLNHVVPEVAYLDTAHSLANAPHVLKAVVDATALKTCRVRNSVAHVHCSGWPHRAKNDGC